MATFALATVAAGGRPVPCLERDGRYFRLQKDLMTFLKPGDRVDAEIESIGKLSVEIGEAA